MSTNSLVGILSTFDNPLLPYTIKGLYAHGINNLCVLLDSKQYGEKNHRLWQDRTGGVFDLQKIYLTDFASNQLPFYLLANHNDVSCVELIKILGVTLLVNGGTPRKLSSELLNSTSGVVNVHPGILPKYRGCTCVEWALYNDDEIGNTAHFMTEDYDAGPIIKSEKYLFSKLATYQDIRVKIYQESIKLMAESVALVLKNGLSPTKMSPQAAGQEFRPISDEKMAIVLQKLKVGMHPSMVL